MIGQSSYCRYITIGWGYGVQKNKKKNQIEKPVNWTNFKKSVR